MKVWVERMVAKGAVIPVETSLSYTLAGIFSTKLFAYQYFTFSSFLSCDRENPACG